MTELMDVNQDLQKLFGGQQFVRFTAMPLEVSFQFLSSGIPGLLPPRIDTGCEFFCGKTRADAYNSCKQFGSTTDSVKLYQNIVSSNIG
ncbi:MAG: hypothetical protein AAF441_23375, partial [Pseudomonadota bacterium]